MPGLRILSVVVSYKRPLEESETIRGLLHSFAVHPELGDSVSVLVWDNSPTPARDLPALPWLSYRHSPRNVGVSGACNSGLKLAEETGCEWLLLLDQDTEIPADFPPRMLELGQKFSSQPEIAAIVPFLMTGDRILSPFEATFKRLRPMRRRCDGVYPTPVSAANSGSLFRVEALGEIGGFDEDFWLDFSDVVVFRLLHERGKRIYVAGELALQHRMAAIDSMHSMPIERYANLVAAEGAYWDIYGTVAERAFHTLRVFERGIRQKRRLKNPAYAKVTFSLFWSRLFSGRKNRLKRWRLESRQRDIPG